MPIFEPCPRPVPAAWERCDWEVVRVLWEAGCGYWWLSRRYVFTQGEFDARVGGFSLRRRERAMASGERHGPKPVGDVTVTDGSSLELWVDCLAGIEYPKFDRTVFPFGEVARFLHNVAGGMPVTLAAPAAGLDPSQVASWRKGEPRFDSLIRRARALAAQRLVRKMMDSDDWRASAWMLERNVAREEFRQEAAQEKLVIEINVSRDQAIAAKHGVIDVTPEVLDGQQMVPGLPAKP